MATTKAQFIAATKDLPYELEYHSSRADGTVNCCLRYTHDFSAVAEAAATVNTRRPSGYDWTLAKTAVQKAQKEHLRPIKAAIKAACRAAGFGVRVHAVNTLGDSLDVAARGLAAKKGGAAVVDGVIHRAVLDKETE